MKVLVSLYEMKIVGGSLTTSNSSASSGIGKQETSLEKNSTSPQFFPSCSTSPVFFKYSFTSFIIVVASASIGITACLGGESLTITRTVNDLENVLFSFGIEAWTLAVLNEIKIRVCCLRKLLQ